MKQYDEKEKNTEGKEELRGKVEPRGKGRTQKERNNSEGKEEHIAKK